MSNQTKTNTTFLCIELLESFSKKELQKFHQFICSPYFNTNERLIKLFNILQKEVLGKSFNNQLQYKVYAIIFDASPNKTLNESDKKSLRSKLSKLNQLAQHFLLTENLKINKNSYHNLLCDALLNKKQFNTIEVIIKREKKRLDAKERKDILDFEHLYALEMHYMGYLDQTGKIYKITNFNPNAIIEKLDVQYIMQKFILYITILTSKEFQTGNKSIDTISLENAECLFKMFDFDCYPILKVLYGIISFLKEPNEEKYKITLSLLDLYQLHIPNVYLNAFYLIILNFLIEEIKRGKLEYENDLVSFYELLDEKELLLEENIMPIIKLKNIVARMCKLKYFDKAKYFTEKYLQFVRKKEKFIIYNVCFAVIAFYQKDFEKALEYIVKVTSSNLTIEVNCRILMMKIYYERDQDYSEKTERLYRSAEKFYNENKLFSLPNKKSYKNFAQILINLYRFKHNEGRMTLAKLRQKLEQQEYNADKKWLLEKMEELKK